MGDVREGQRKWTRRGGQEQGIGERTLAEGAGIGMALMDRE